MYSPKIDEKLIPKLYRLAKSRNKPMTKIVNEIIAAHLEGIKPLDVQIEESSFESLLKDKRQNIIVLLKNRLII